MTRRVSGSKKKATDSTATTPPVLAAGEQASTWQEDRTLIHGTSPHERFVIAPAMLIAELAAVHRALAESATWGDFVDALPRWALASLQDASADELPSRECVFDAAEVPGVEDNEFPPMLESMYELWMPAPLLRRCAGASSALREEWLELAPSQVATFLRAANKLGFQCIEDSDVLATAYGVT